MRATTRMTGFAKKTVEKLVEDIGEACAEYQDKTLRNVEAVESAFGSEIDFARIHQTLRCTPAMEAGVSDHVWSIEEIAALLD